MSGNPRVTLLIPDGVGVRNFLFGGFLPALCQVADVDVFHAIPDSMIGQICEGQPDGVRWYPMRPYRQTEVGLLLQYAVTYAQMYWADTMAMRRIRNQPVRGSWKNQALQHTTKLLGRAGASPARMRILDRAHFAAVERLADVEYYRALFREQNPSVVFCSHQRPSVVLPAVLAARSLGIPTASFIFSWDNITSKGRIVAPFDHYLVWSEHMKQELIRYYPDVSPSQIHIVGTPQFEPYADSSILLSKEEFFRSIGADPGRPLICYSGGDKGTCPEDQEHVRILMELIRAGAIRGNPQVIVRPAPADDGERYKDVCRCFPELIFAQPKWEHAVRGDWSRIVPSREDIPFLANLTAHADLNVNLGSTMTLDFGVHDTPVVNIAFDVADPPIFGMPVWDYYYFFEHYRPVVELGAARFARSRDQLPEHVNAYLADPSLDRAGRRQLFALQVGVPIGKSNSTIVETLQTLAS